MRGYNINTGFCEKKPAAPGPPKLNVVLDGVRGRGSGPTLRSWGGSGGGTISVGGFFFAGWGTLASSAVHDRAVAGIAVCGRWWGLAAQMSATAGGFFSPNPVSGMGSKKVRAARV